MQTSQRLVELYHRATVDSGRFEHVERQRFVLHLLEKLKQHRDVLNAPIPTFDAREPWQLFINRRAAYQGREMGAAFAFIMDELQSRIGTRMLCDTLYRCSNEIGLGIARRLATPRGTAGLRLSCLRTVVDDKAQDAQLSSSFLSFGECARHDLVLPTDCSSMRLAIGIDNCGDSAAHFPCVELRIQVQTRRHTPLRSTQVCVLGSLLKIESGRRAWIALRGVDLLAELRSELAAGEELYALRFLLTRK